MYKKSNITRKSEKPSRLDQHPQVKPTTSFHPASFHSRTSLGKFFNGTNKPNTLFFTFNPHSQKVYGYQQRFISTSKLDPIEWQTILKKLRDNDASLSKLELQYKQLGDAGAKELAIALPDNHTLTELNLEDNQISAIGAKALATVLKQNRTLTKLNLGGNYNCFPHPHNTIGDEGAMELATVLKTNHTLTVLDLKFNQIGNEGAKALASAIKANRTLIELDLAGNRIGNAGATELATTLEENHSLAVLNLRINEIDDKGAKALANAIKANRTLIELDLSFNGITKVGVEEFEIALQTNHTLTWFGLSGCGELLVYSSRGDVADVFSGDHMADNSIKRNLFLRDEMHEAVKKGDMSAVNQFLQQGVSLLETSGHENNTALHWAIVTKQPRMAAHLFRLMRQQGLPVDIRNFNNKTAADLAKGTEFEALFTSSTSTFPAQDNMAYTAFQSLPANNKKSEATKSDEAGFTPKNKF